MGGGDAVLLAGAALAPVAFALGGIWLVRAMRCDSAARGRGSEARRPKIPLGQLVLGNLILFGLVLSILFLGGEVWFRFFRDTTDSYSLSRVSKRWFARHWRRNRTGVRDNIEYTYERVRGKRRITFLGDSFAAGHGVADVEERFANRLRAEYAGRWEVHVLAAAGLDTGAQLEHLRDFVGAGYRLDTVVLVYCLNDISDLLPQWHAVMERIHRGAGDEPWLVRHSFLVNSLYYRFRGLGDPDVANYYGFVGDAYEGLAWERQQERLRALVGFCRANGARFAVVTFPFMHCLGEGYPYRKAHERLTAFWESLGVSHLDLLGVFEAGDSSELTVGAFDAHPNARAHGGAAEAIGPFLERVVEGKP